MESHQEAMEEQDLTLITTDVSTSAGSTQVRPLQETSPLMATPPPHIMNPAGLIPPASAMMMSDHGHPSSNQPPLLVSPPLMVPGGDLRPFLNPSKGDHRPIMPPSGGPPHPFIGPPGTNLPLLMSSSGDPRPLLGPPPPIMAHLIRGPPPDIAIQGPSLLGSGNGPLWVEHTTSDGQLYYSDPVTKKTIWEKPQGVRIVPFSQLEPSTLGPPPGMGGAPVPPGVPLVSQRVWSEHKNPEGKVYYYNKVTCQSVWEKPKDFELVMPLPANLASPSQEAISASSTNTTTSEPASTDVIQASSVDLPLPATKTSILIPFSQPPNNAPPMLPSNDALKPDPPPPELMPDTSQKELLALVVAKLGAGPAPPPTVKPVIIPPKVEEKKGPHPVESIPVPGTPWSIVFTSDEKQFFFDSTNRKSIWKMPPELINSSTVQKILENPPWKKKRVGELEEPPSKKMKLAALVGEEEDSEEESKKPVVVETKMEGIEVDLSSAVKAEIAERNRELKAAELRARLSLEERQDMFKAMLLERGVSAFSTWEKELPKFVFDERYQLLLVKERKGIFDEFVAARVEEEMKEKKQQVKEKKDTFMKFLQECKITPKTTFTEFIRQYARHEKFKVIEKMKEREALFNEYVSELKKMSKLKNEEQKQSQKKKTEKEKEDFLSMLKEEEKRLSEKSQWKKVKHWFQKDSRYKAIDSSSKKEELFNEYIKSLNRDEKEELIAASLRERERQVQLSRSAQEKQWDLEKEQLRRTEAQQHFASLLVDLIKDPLSSWSESKRLLRRDQRWEMSELIDISEREKLFRDHISQLSKKRRLQFRKLLEETVKITLTMPWKKARKYIKDDVRYKGFSDNDRDREDEYERYLHDRMKRTKEDFKDLLQETKMITYKTRDTIHSTERHLTDIIEVLKNDKRYLILDCVEDERDAILLEYIDELHAKGPPPPPTATHPSERLKK